MLVSMNRSDLPYLKEQDFASHTAIYVLIGGNVQDLLNSGVLRVFGE